MPTPSVNVTFVKDATTVTLPGPSGPTDVSPLPRFVTDLSANHTRWSYQTTTAKTNQWSVSLDDLTGAQRTAFQSFFEDTAKGPTNTFTYTHTDGNSYTVRFIDTVLRWRRVNGTMWSVSFVMELSSEPV